MYRLEELLPAELEQRIAEKPAAIVPFGTLEWHSYHLPVGLDSIKANLLCERLAEESGAVLVPSTHWAVGGVPFPYTMGFDLGLIETLAGQVFRQLGMFGFRTIVALTGHFGLEHTLALKRSALQTMRQTTLTIFAGGEFEAVTDLGYHGDHAAKWETSLLMALRPELVQLNRVDASQPLDGIIGEDPRQNASPVLGKEMADLIVARLAELINKSLSQMTNVQRAQYIEAVGTGVRALEQLLVARQTLPKSQVPPLATPAYIKFLDALYRGEYVEAQKYAEAKLVSLSA